MNANEAWDKFTADSLGGLEKSAPIQGQLDTISSQINEIAATTSRLGDLIPQLMGDETALDTAGMEAEPQPSVDDILGDDMGGVEEAPMGEEVPTEEAPVEEEAVVEEEVEKAAPDEEVPMLENEDEMDVVEEAPADVSVDGAVDEMPEEDIMVEEEVAPAAPSEAADVPEPASTEIPGEGLEADVGLYADVLEALMRAITRANANGNAEQAGALIKSAEELTAAFGNLASTMDEVYGVNAFTKSMADCAGDEDMCDDISKSAEPSNNLPGTEPTTDMIKEAPDAPPAGGFTDAESANAEPVISKSADDIPGGGVEKHDPGHVDMNKSKARAIPSIEDIMAGLYDDHPERYSIGGMVEMTKCADCADHADQTHEMETIQKSDGPVTMEKSEEGEVEPVIEDDIEKACSEKSAEDGAVVEDELEKCNTQPDMADDVGDMMTKSAGKPIATLADLRKSAGAQTTRPPTVSTANGDVTTPTFGNARNVPVLHPMDGDSFADLYQATERDIDSFHASYKQGRY